MKYNSKEKLQKLWSERLMTQSERAEFRKKEKTQTELMKSYRPDKKKRAFEKSNHIGDF